MAISHIRAFMATLGIICLPALCLAQSQSNVSEKPWIDFSKFPLDSEVSLDMNELTASKITDVSASRATNLFVFVRRLNGTDGTAYFVNITHPIDAALKIRNKKLSNEEKVAAISGKADVQLGNGRAFKTFSVDGPLSICYVTSEQLSCEHGIDREVVDTP
jgi:hypothetical protein